MKAQVKLFNKCISYARCLIFIIANGRNVTYDWLVDRGSPLRCPRMVSRSKFRIISKINLMEDRESNKINIIANNSLLIDCYRQSHTSLAKLKTSSVRTSA